VILAKQLGERAFRRVPIDDELRYAICASGHRPLGLPIVLINFRGAAVRRSSPRQNTSLRSPAGQQGHRRASASTARHRAMFKGFDEDGDRKALLVMATGIFFTSLL
jgi:hypothetical protein